MKTNVLRVVAKTASFRRAGYLFSATPTDIPLTDLSAVQKAAITADPALVAYETESDVTEGGADTEAKPANKAKK